MTRHAGIPMTCPDGVQNGDRPRGYPGRWVGRFIWDHGDRVPRHYHLMARRAFTLAATPQQARLRIAVCDRYRLFVNGVYVGRGAARITRPQWMPYDTYDVAARLRPGANTLAVLAHHYGCPNNYTADLPAGIFVELKMALPGGSQPIVASDGEWRVCAIQGYRRDTPVLNGWHGIANEILDAGRDPSAWMQPEFDDAAWGSPKVLNADLDPMRWSEDESPWSCLEPRRTPPLRERRVPPARIVKTAEAVEEPLDPDAESDICERLTQEQHASLEHAAITDAEALVGGKGPARLAGTPAAGERAARSPVVVLDFGRPLFGCPDMTLTAPAGAVVDLFYGNELVGEGAAARPAPDTAMHIGDRLIARAGRQTWQLSDTRQFRYLQMVVRAAADPVTLERVEFISLEYPAEARGAFACADPVLTRVWEAGVNTVYLHMEDTHVCDATRERRQYMAAQELRGGLRAIYAAYGDRALVEETLRATKRLQRPNGSFDVYSGSSGHASGFPRLPYSLNSYSGFSLGANQYWGYPLAVWDHYMRFGDRTLLTMHYPSIERLREFYECFVADGLIHNLPGMNFMDWANHSLRGANLCANAGYAAMLDTMARMLNEMGHSGEESRLLSARAEDIRRCLHERHWHEDRGLFVDSIADSASAPVFSVYTNAYAILLGVADERQRQRILERVFDPNDPLTRPTPLCIGFIAEALILAGAVDQTLKMLSDRFGPALDSMDVPTLPEAWPDQAFSGASQGGIHDSPCGIMMTLQERILGVSPAAPGFARCRIGPRLGSLAWARGIVPTSRGDVRVSWEQPESGVLRFEIETPTDMAVDLDLPRASASDRMTLNGRPVAIAGPLDLPGGVLTGSLHSTSKGSRRNNITARRATMPRTLP